VDSGRVTCIPIRPTRPGAAEVHAIFYNFSHLTSTGHSVAWDSPSPPMPLRSGEASAVAALRRAASPTMPCRTRGSTLGQAGSSAALDGAHCRGQLALPWPDEPFGRVCGTPPPCCVEQRGDAHVRHWPPSHSGRDCNVLHYVANRVPRDFLVRSRQYDDDEWRSCTARWPQGHPRDTGALNAEGAASAGHRGHHRPVGVAAFDVLDDGDSRSCSAR